MDWAPVGFLATAFVRQGLWIGGGSMRLVAALLPVEVHRRVAGIFWRACRYEPDLNRTYHEMAQYYSIAVLPARPTAPMGKGNS